MDETFLRYASLFASHGHSLYMVGGASRDYLLGREFHDYDFTTDATPDEMKEFLPDASYAFARFGSIRIDEGENEIDITTLRQEGEYKDSRHPESIVFIEDPRADSVRRDFTINALYLKPDGAVLDFHHGLEDLSSKTIRFIGDPRKRIEEDPLRILRAERFSRALGFSLAPEDKEAIEELRPLLSKLNPNKVKMEEQKEAKRR